jgi:hypothetical protein
VHAELLGAMPEIHAPLPEASDFVAPDSFKYNGLAKLDQVATSATEFRASWMWTGSTQILDQGQVILSFAVTNVPPGAVVTNVSVSYVIQHSQPADLKVFVYNTNRAWVVRNGESAAGSVIGETRMEESFFAGEHPTTYWFYCVRDMAAGNTGVLQSVSLSVYYETAKPTARIMPAMVSYVKNDSGTNRLAVVPGAPAEYLIITSTNLAPSFQLLADYRARRNGMTTAVLTKEWIATAYSGVDEPEKIRACIRDYVASHGTLYVVLGGDSTLIPVRECYASNTADDNSFLVDIPADSYYADARGDWDRDHDGVYGEADTVVGDEGNFIPDVLVGRIPVRVESHVANYIQKVIGYESARGMPGRMLMLGNQMSPVGLYTATNRPGDTLNDGYSGFLSHDPVSDSEMWSRRLYRDAVEASSNPPPLSCFFDTLTSWDGSTAGQYQMDSMNLTTALNQGWDHVFVVTHGSVNAWTLEQGLFGASKVASVTGRMGVVYAVACLTSMFDSTTDPALSEAFLRSSSGPVAYIGYSRPGWYEEDAPPASPTSRGGSSFEYAYDFYGQLFRGGWHSLGEVFYQHKAMNAAVAGTGNTMRWMYLAMNYLGDPALFSAENGGAREFRIYNDGYADLHVSAITMDQSAAYIQWAPVAPFVVAPGSNVLMHVMIDTNALPGGTVVRQLLIASDDAGVTSSVATIDVQTATPLIQIRPESLDFGVVPLGTNIALHVDVENIGGGLLQGDVAALAPFNMIANQPYALSFGEVHQMAIMFAPVVPGVYTGALVFAGGGGATCSVAGVAIGHGDRDHDGYTDWQEYVSGSNPDDPTNRFSITGMQTLPWAGISWPSLAGRVYRVYDAGAGMLAWSNVFEVAGSGQLQTYSNRNPAAAFILLRLTVDLMPVPP